MCVRVECVYVCTGGVCVWGVYGCVYGVCMYVSHAPLSIVCVTCTSEYCMCHMHL